MSKNKKKTNDIEVNKPKVQSSIKTKKFPLKQDYNGKKAKVDFLEVGPKGEEFYKSKNII